MQFFSTWVCCNLMPLVTAGHLSTIAYLPEYRHAYDIEGAVQSGMISDVVLFSVEVSSGGGLEGVHRLPSAKRISQLRADGAKLHLCIGGAGRSSGFPGLSDVQVRKKTVSAIVRLVKMLHLDGVDVDWEAPRNEAQWRVLGKLLKDIRRAWTKVKEPHVDVLLLSFTLWPHDLQNMLAAKAGSKTLVDLVDRIHMMTYSGDEDDAVTSWEQTQLPLNRLAFGVRFFLDNGSPYYEIPASDLDSKMARNERQRVLEASFFALKKGLAGIFIWEIGQDVALRKIEDRSLLGALHDGMKQDMDEL